jgi:hypothetical protein
MFKWKKLGRIFDPTLVKEKDWLKEFAQAPSVLIFDKFIRVYFACRPLRDENGQYVSYTGYVDFNRFNLKEILNIANKPVLSLGEAGTFDEFGTYPTSVLRHNNEIIAYYGGWTRCESVPFNVSIGIAKSIDEGKTFNKLGPGPVLSFSLDEPFIISGPKIRRFNNIWYLFYIAGKKWVKTGEKAYSAEPVYKIRMAASNDGIYWNRVNSDLIESKLENDEAQASPDVFYYKDMYHMFYCYRNSLNYRENNRGYRIGYAYSDDLMKWTRDDNKSGIDISKDGWDGESISYPHVFELDDNLYMLYLGNQVGRYGFGLAKLEEYN